MSYEFYKILHIISLLFLFFSFGMLITQTKYLKKLILSLHGLSVLILFVSGFGLIAKTGISLQIKNPFGEDWWIFAGLTTLLTISFIGSYFFSKISNHKIFQFLSNSLLVLLILYFTMYLSKILQPQWIGKKMMIWIVLACCVPFLNAKHENQQHASLQRILTTLFIFIFIAFYTVRYAIYKN